MSLKRAASGGKDARRHPQQTAQRPQARNLPELPATCSADSPPTTGNTAKKHRPRHTRALGTSHTRAHMNRMRSPTRAYPGSRPRPETTARRLTSSAGESRRARRVEVPTRRAPSTSAVPKGPPICPPTQRRAVVPRGHACPPPTSRHTRTQGRSATLAGGQRPRSPVLVAGTAILLITLGSVGGNRAPGAVNSSTPTARLAQARPGSSAKLVLHQPRPTASHQQGAKSSSQRQTARSQSLSSALKPLAKPQPEKPYTPRASSMLRVSRTPRVGYR